MRDFSNQLEILKKDGIVFSSKDLPKNSLGYVEKYPLEFDAWVKRVETVISKYFATSSAQYSILQKGLKYYEGIAVHRNPEFLEHTRDTLLKCIDLSLESLEADDFEEITFAPIKDDDIVKSNKIFIVHGHDEKLKIEVARFLEKLELEPIILHEQANKGRTIIEKFEDYSDVGFAIVLLTADDFGNIKNQSENLNQRARQNVIFELGFFIGKLRRQNVCALYQKDIELPSDYNGVIYIPVDENQGWKFKLARELKASGITIDMNKLA